MAFAESLAFGCLMSKFSPNHNPGLRGLPQGTHTSHVLFFLFSFVMSCLILFYFTFIDYTSIGVILFKFNKTFEWNYFLLLLHTSLSSLYHVFSWLDVTLLLSNFLCLFTTYFSLLISLYRHLIYLSYINPIHLYISMAEKRTLGMDQDVGFSNLDITLQVRYQIHILNYHQKS